LNEYPPTIEIEWLVEFKSTDLKIKCHMIHVEIREVMMFFEMAFLPIGDWRTYDGCRV